MFVSLQVPSKVWIEVHESGFDTPQSCDVIVQMEDGHLYTAHFVTLAYIRHQMNLSYEVTKQIEETPAVRYTALETPHLVVDEINPEIIEDTIDNLIVLETFEALFTKVTEDEADQTSVGERTSTRTGALATQAHAKVVLSEVLVITTHD